MARRSYLALSLLLAAPRMCDAMRAAPRAPALQRACRSPAVCLARSRRVRAEESPSVPSADEKQASSLIGQAGEAADAVYRFSRPHTIRGTLLACFTGVGRALIEQPIYLALIPALLPRAMLGVLALLLGNLFIVGINQIYDVEIDEINKPFLPIAAGRISPRAAWAIVLGSGIAGLAIVKAAFNPLIFGLYAFGTIIGALYSVPPFQFKRFPLAAGLTIATCRGFLLNFGVYYATREALGLGFLWSAPVAFLARFMTVYAAVIAVTKDLGDIEGDRRGGIETFASRFGPGLVAKGPPATTPLDLDRALTKALTLALITVLHPWPSRWPDLTADPNLDPGASATLFLNYLAAIATPLLAAPGTFRVGVMTVGHALAAGWLLRSTAKLKPDSSASIKQYYKQIWNLFYFEYLMYPFI